MLSRSVAVLGAGNGQAAAADLSLAGYQVNLRASFDGRAV